jgi:hypothetical protein
MPDLLTHLVVAQGCRTAARGGWLTSWFLIGAVLPDLLLRPISIGFPELFWFFMPLHTPVGLFLVCMLISGVQQEESRRLVFYNLLGGVGLHLFLDFFQKHIGGGYYLLFPFSWRSLEWGLFWPETSLYLLPVWIGGGLVFGVRAFRQWRRQRNGFRLLSRYRDNARVTCHDTCP